MLTSSLVLATLATRALAAPTNSFLSSQSSNTSTTTVGNASCTNFIYPITASGTNIKLNLTTPTDQQQINAAYLEQYSSGSTYAKDIMLEEVAVNGTFDIAFQFCEPVSGSSNQTVYQAIHGIVGTKAYWDVNINGSSSLSFVQAATGAGYSTLVYDRLTVGNSSKPEGIQIAQAGIEVGIAIEIANMLRNGSFGLGQFDNVVGVGHSFGSIQLVGAAYQAPDAFDALILTGFSANGTIGPVGLSNFGSTIASVAYPERFGNLTDNSYVITGTQSNDQLGFFHYPNYPAGALDTFTAGKGTYTLGELQTLTSPLNNVPVNYSKPVFVVTGENDAVFCSGNCYSNPASYMNVTLSSVLDTSKALFPGVSDGNFSTYVVPATGHAVNFHSSAPEAYAQINAFLADHEL